MAKPNKASITYSTGINAETGESIDNVLRFHTVIAEQHNTSAEVTKFPVASQKFVSNHTIRKNRKISITGMVSNHVVIGQGEMHQYGQDNTKIIFAELKRLIQEGVPCEVNTNLGIYSPVIFTNFQTKQEAGMTDAMKFVLSGEEIILGRSVNATTPAVLIFKPLDEEAKQAKVYELLQAGIEVDPSAEISEAEFDPNKSFVLRTKADNGNTIDVTYERQGYDSTTKKYSHLVHTSDTDVVGAEVEDIVAAADDAQTALPKVGQPKGVEIATACITDHGVDFIQELADENFQTSLGKLKKSAYGAKYKVLGVNGDRSFGQRLLGLGVDCFVVGAVGVITGEVPGEDYEKGMPTVEDILDGAASKGNEVVTDILGVASPSTITKISTPIEAITFFGGSN